MMFFSELLSPLLKIARLFPAFFGKKKSHPFKKLEAKIINRCIVAELPEVIPFKIVNEAGDQYKGIYVIGLLIWNTGNQAITKKDFPKKNPLIIEIDKNTELAGYDVIPVYEEISCSLEKIETNKLRLRFDFLNPQEYVVIQLFVTSDPYVPVNICGRFSGQEEPIDQTALEAKASLSERFIAFFMLILIFNAMPVCFIALGFIYVNYGFDMLINDMDKIPSYLLSSVSTGVIMWLLFIYSRLTYWFEKKKYPKGYPLMADLELPIWGSVKAFFNTLFFGKKQRVSVSLFNWGEPVLLSHRKVPRKNANDWVI